MQNIFDSTGKDTLPYKRTGQFLNKVGGAEKLRRQFGCMSDQEFADAVSKLVSSGLFSIDAHGEILVLVGSE